MVNKKVLFSLVFIMFLVGISYVSAENMMEKNKNEIEKIYIIYPFFIIIN